MVCFIQTEIDEALVAHAIRAGELKLEVILQCALSDDRTLRMLIDDIEPLGGTKDAGAMAAKFAAAMQKA